MAHEASSPLVDRGTPSAPSSATRTGSIPFASATGDMARHWFPRGPPMMVLIIVRSFALPKIAMRGGLRPWTRTGLWLQPRPVRTCASMPDRLVAATQSATCATTAAGAGTPCGGAAACAAHLSGQYGVDDLYVGVPCVIGAGGVEKIVEIELSEEAKANFKVSVDAVKELLEACKAIDGSLA